MTTALGCLLTVAIAVVLSLWTGNAEKENRGLNMINFMFFIGKYCVALSFIARLCDIVHSSLISNMLPNNLMKY